MAAVGSMKRWFLFNLRRAVGTQTLLEQFSVLSPTSTRGRENIPEPPLVAPATSAVEAVATNMLMALHARIADAGHGDDLLGLRRDQLPALVCLNGDLIWLPGDLLKYVIHTRQQADPRFVVHLQAETPHYAWIRERLRPGDTVVDCGANLGLFATMMAARVGPTGSVHAFEPSPRSRADLARVLQLNELTWVVINPCAVADRCGQATFCDVLESDVRREASHLSSASRFTSGLTQQAIEVPTITLDHYVREAAIRPRLIKIDVEGAELDVLDGAHECIRRHRPRLVVEFHPDAKTGAFDHDRLRRFLNEHDYSFRADNREYYCEPK